nr:transcription factor SPT20 homolog isoform X4 [Procambarus clarkii]
MLKNDQDGGVGNPRRGRTLSSPNSAEVSGSPSPAPSSIGNNAPKYGTLVPNRVFVGGISASTTEQDLLELFSQYGAVKATKIISDRAGVSKGYGFVTFETEEEARRLTQEADNIMLKDRKLNIAPAIKKQVSDVGYMKTYSPHLIESNSNVVGSGGAVFFSNGTSYATYGNTVPVLTPTEYHPTFPQAPAAPTTPSAYQTLVYPQPIYYPQQYQYQPTQTVQPQWGAAPQWRWITPLSYAQPECGPQQCSVEPSSQAQGEFATASVLGSSPLASTPITLACPSTPTTATTTTAVCTAFTTTSSTSTKTTATTSTITKSVRTHDTLLQIKPLSLASKSTLCGKSKSIPTVVPKTTLSLDKNNNTAEQGGWGKRQRNTSQYPANIPPRFLRSEPSQQQKQQRRQRQQQQQQPHHQQNQYIQQLCGFINQHNSQQLPQFTEQNRQELWTGEPYEKYASGGNTEGSRTRKQQTIVSDANEEWKSNWCRQPPIPCAWVLHGGYEQQQQQQHHHHHQQQQQQQQQQQKQQQLAEQQHCWDWGMATSDTSWEECRMGVPFGTFYLMPSSYWRNDTSSWQSYNSTGISPTNVPIMDIPWMASDSITYSSIQPQEHDRQQSQQRQQGHVVATPESFNTQRDFTVCRSPATTVFPRSTILSMPPSIGHINYSIPYQHSDNSRQGYIPMLDNCSQQQQPYHQFNQYFEQQDDQSLEQFNSVSEPLPGSIPWEWTQTDDLWVYEPSTFVNDAILPVWGNSNTMLPVGFSCSDAVAIDPDSYTTPLDPNSNRSIKGVGDFSAPLNSALHSMEP